MEAVIILVVFGVVLVGSLLWQSSRSQDILAQWAEENGYRLLEANYATFFKGPFTLTSARGQTVYRVVVQDEAGFTRTGWVRCGSWWGGLMSGQAQVRWDE